MVHSFFFSSFCYEPYKIFFFKIEYNHQDTLKVNKFWRIIKYLFTYYKYSGRC